MNKTKRWITLFLALIALSLIGWNIADNSQDDSNSLVKQDDPTYTIGHSQTLVYNPTGRLDYKLVSDKAAYFTSKELSWFDNPVMTAYDQNHLAGWLIRANKAKLTKNRMLYLYGQVEVNSLTKKSQLRQIKTDNAIIDLTTQDISSNDRVTLYGASFNSTGMRMRGNLRENSARLIEKVKTCYEITKLQS